MDIDDEAIHHGSGDEDHMMVDGIQVVASMSSQPDDAMQTDEVAATGPDMDEEMETGDKEDDGDELMVVTEDDEKLEEPTPTQSARMSPVDETVVVVQPFPSFPTIETPPLHSPTPAAISQPFTSNLGNTPPAWPPAPTDVPVVPSRLPDALSVVESGIAAEHEEEKQMDAGTPPSVRAEPSESVDNGNVVEATDGGDNVVEAQSEEKFDEPKAAIADAQDTTADTQFHAEDQSRTMDEFDQHAGQNDPDHLAHQVVAEEDIEESMEDVIPPILLIFSDTLSRSLFFPLPNDIDPPSSLIGDVVLEQKAEEIAHAPLEEFFMELRLALGEEWDDTKGVDMVLEQRDVQLTIKENDKQTLQLSLMDIIALHMRLGCPQPLIFHVSSTPENFYRRYKTILGMLDAREASEHEDDEEEQEEGEGEGEGKVNDGDEGVEEGVVKEGEQNVDESTAELKETNQGPVASALDEQSQTVVAEGEQDQLENVQELTNVNEFPADAISSQTDTAVDAGSSSAPAAEQHPDAEISNEVSEQDTERQDDQEFIEGEDEYEIYDEAEGEHEEEHDDQAPDHEQGAEEEKDEDAGEAPEDDVEHEHVVYDEENVQGAEDEGEDFEDGEEYEEYEDPEDEYGVNGAIAAAETMVDEGSQFAEIPEHPENLAASEESTDAVATNGHDDVVKVNGGTSPKKRSLEEGEQDDDSRNVKQKLEEVEGGAQE